MDSKKLEILMTAVSLGSFSKASEVVGYTQSGLTHLINGLEREIGMTLIRRDHSGIALTEDGEALLPAIREYLSATARLENQIEAITKKRTATIRIAAYASVAMHWMPEIMMRGRTQGVRTLPVSPKAGRELGMGMHLSRNTPEEILRLRACVLDFTGGLS